MSDSSDDGQPEISAADRGPTAPPPAPPRESGEGSLARGPAACPGIATYELCCASVRMPRGCPRWIAKYAVGGTLLPPTFEGVSEAEAVLAATMFWAGEQIALARARAARGDGGGAFGGPSDV